MTNPKLVAAIPVDEVFAKGKRPVPWMMPADKLYGALGEKTKGRILHRDKNFPQGEAMPDALNAQEWQRFKNAVKRWIAYSSITFVK